MKKFYSLITVVSLASAINAQTTVASTITGINEGVVSTTNDPEDNNLTYTADKGTAAASPAYFTGNPGHLRIYSVRATGEGNTFTITPAEDLIITSVTFKALTTTPTVTYSVAGGDTQNADLSDKTYTLINSSETPGALTFKNAYYTGGSGSNVQLRIAEISVTYKSSVTLAAVEASKEKVNFVKNTIVTQDIIFGSSAKVSIYNTSGQIVMSAEVSNNTRLDVSNLPKGMYIVTGLIDGKTISQKIIKK